VIELILNKIFPTVFGFSYKSSGFSPKGRYFLHAVEYSIFCLFKGLYYIADLVAMTMDMCKHLFHLFIEVVSLRLKDVSFILIEDLAHQHLEQGYF
jgi:hypothetical protein